MLGLLSDLPGAKLPDETGNVKKGIHTVRVQSRYTDTAGRIENSQVVVYAGRARTRGGRPGAAHPVLLDVRPRKERSRAAGLGQDALFTTKPEPAWVMIEQSLHAGHRVGWVTGDEAYGGNEYCERLWRIAASVTSSRRPVRPKCPPVQARSAPTPW
ncbi:transposase [Streptomyces sp. DT2A-34]|uniref:transposase n=1 Tax=Streptomyces sp. DT2A-34 TaxID=3051182 RepID=UPI00265C3145|nr:transposase [Streptomyces sp. DT2A-34]MDO0913482.1 transposase [Streptomyces sp. DT2A-34]